MKLKKGLIATTLALALVVPTTVFAATSTSTAAIKIRGLFGIDSSKLTTAQLADVKDYAQKLAVLQKDLFDKMVSNGSMSQTEADAQKAKIDENLANGEIFIGSSHAMKDKGDFKGNKIDTSKLNDGQKKTLLDLEKEQLALQNDLAKILVEQKLISQTQADAIKTKVDAAISSLSTTNINKKLLGDSIGRLNILQGITLTDTQKTAILDWTAKSATVQKKIVALYINAGIITQAQADTLNAQIDARAADPLSFGNMRDSKMGKGNMGEGRENGRRGGHGRDFNSGSNQTSGSAISQ